MAGIRLGSIVSDIRGSIGAETFSRNQGGLFVRERVTPADPSSAAQVLARAAVTACSQYWSGTLSEPQRDAWRSYAGANPIPDRWGQPKFTSGYVWFLRVNVGWYRTKEAIGFPAPPTTPPLSQPTFTLEAQWEDAPDLLHFHLELSGNPAPYPGLGLHLSAGIPVNPGVAFYAGPWLTVDIDEYIPGWFLNLDYHTDEHVNVIGQRLWARARFQDTVTGAVGTWFQANAIITSHSLPGAGNPTGTPIASGTWDFDFTWTGFEAIGSVAVYPWAVAENTDTPDDWFLASDDAWYVQAFAEQDFGIIVAFVNTRTGQEVSTLLPDTDPATYFFRVTLSNLIGPKRRGTIEIFSNPARTVLIYSDTFLTADANEPATYEFLFAYNSNAGITDETGNLQIRNYEDQDGHMDFNTDWTEVDAGARLTIVGDNGFNIDPIGETTAVQLYFDTVP